MLFSELFRQGLFEVPWHQRYYDWRVGHVRALLQDIDDAIKEGRDCYFLGAIMLVENGKRQWKINDGQQRMVTMSLIYAALCRRFSEESCDSQREGLALHLLFDLSTNVPCTLRGAEGYVPRLTPPTNDMMRYRQMIRGNTIGSNGLLTTAWTEIEKFFSPMSLERSKSYFDFLLQKLEIVCLRIPTRIDSNAIYETINCRGKPLEDLDLIRNYLYAHFNEADGLEKKNSVHDSLERMRTVIPHTRKASDYLRCHLQCKYGFLPKDDFYRKAREAIRNQKDKSHGKKELSTDYVFHLIQQLATPENLQLFKVITASSPDPEFIKAFEVASRTTNSLRNLTVFLRELNSYTVSLPLVFAILYWYMCETDGRKKRRIARIANKNLHRLATFVLRTAFVAPKFESSHFETEFSNYAQHIMSSSDLPDNGFSQFLKNCDHTAFGILDDSRFKSAMLEKTQMKGINKIKHFLIGVNSKLQPDAELINIRKCSIEHILPKSSTHWVGWTGFNGVDQTEWTERIGNLTLMGVADNKPGGRYNNSFAKKQQSYLDSSIKLTREVGEDNDWNPKKIMEREKKMVTHAADIWTFK